MEVDTIQKCEYLPKSSSKKFKQKKVCIYMCVHIHIIHTCIPIDWCEYVDMWHPPWHTKPLNSCTLSAKSAALVTLVIQNPILGSPKRTLENTTVKTKKSKLFWGNLCQRFVFLVSCMSLARGIHLCFLEFLHRVSEVSCFGAARAQLICWNHQENTRKYKVQTKNTTTNQLTKTIQSGWAICGRVFLCYLVCFCDCMLWCFAGLVVWFVAFYRLAYARIF